MRIVPTNKPLGYYKFANIEKVYFLAILHFVDLQARPTKGLRHRHRAKIRSGWKMDF